MDKVTHTIDSRTGESTSLKHSVMKSQPLSGGLYTPTSLPQFSSVELASMANMSYQELAKMILGWFDWGMPDDKLTAIIDAAYGAQWHSPEITPVKHVGENMHSLHLGYGPTFAFKNIALEFLPRILSELTKGQIIHVLWASSGDTINAAHHGVKWTNINSLFMLPSTGPSAVQRLQATHGIVENRNALTILADAPFDPLQDIVKKVNSPEHADLKTQYGITSFNSINIARILAQTVYYFRAYAEMVKTGSIENGDEIIFSVPSGNFGDALAWLYAKEMGLPIKTINVATNENDMLHDFFLTGVYEPKTIHVTNAPSQDISKSSNFERALLWACNDPEQVKKWYDELAREWSFCVDRDTLKKLQSIFTSSTSTDAEREHTIRHMAWVHNHGIDPHTATGVYPIIMGEFGTQTPVVFLETSHVAQFGEELRERGIIVPGMDEFDETIAKMRKQAPEEGLHFLRAGSKPEDIMEKVQQGLSLLSTRK